MQVSNSVCGSNIQRQARPKTSLTVYQDFHYRCDEKLQRVESTGLVDSGATVNVLLYEIGLQLGGVWDDGRAVIQLAGNLSNQPAMPFSAIA